MKLSIPSSAAGMRLSDYLNQCGIPHAAPCGGNGVCGKCTVTVAEGVFYTYGDETRPVIPDGEGRILSCRAVCPSTGAVILVDEVSVTDVSGVEENLHREAEDDYGLALDIGTTTLAAALVSLTDGKSVATASCLNPQSGFGADVMSRISAAAEGKLASMQAVLLTGVKSLIESLFSLLDEGILAKGGRLPEIKKMTVVGNPTMLHIFCGVSPVGMGQYPFTPVFLETKTLSGKTLGLPVEEVTVLPSASAFVGADVVGGAATVSLDRAEKPCLILDVGTNGEMILACGDRLYATSCAAGPALEGAGISCGMGGVAGAVSSVTLSGDTLRFRTVGDKPPRGITGSGLVDLAAALLTLGVIDETGAMDDSFRLTGIHVTAAGEGNLMPTRVSLTGEDVRALQLVKSAFRAGIETLLSVAGIKAEALAHTYLAGGLGYYLSPENAARIGLLPEGLLPSVKVIGNGALSAAVKGVCDDEFVKTMSNIALCCETIELNEQPLFNELFIEYMMFE